MRPTTTTTSVRNLGYKSGGKARGSGSRAAKEEEGAEEEEAERQKQTTTATTIVIGDGQSLSLLPGRARPGQADPVRL